MKTILHSRILLLVLTIFATIGATTTVLRATASAAPTLPLRPHVSPTYTDCLWTGNSITAGADLLAPYTSAWEGYLINDLDAQRNASDCLRGHYTGFEHGSWCTTDGLGAMQAANYHPNVQLVLVQFGENEFGAPCRKTPAQYGADLATLLAYIHTTSPTATLVCTTMWHGISEVNTLGYSVADYNAAATATCNAAGFAETHVVDITTLYPTWHYHSLNMCCGDAYHPDMFADASIAQEITDALP